MKEFSRGCSKINDRSASMGYVRKITTSIKSIRKINLFNLWKTKSFICSFIHHKEVKPHREYKDDFSRDLIKESLILMTIEIHMSSTGTLNLVFTLKIKMLKTNHFSQINEDRWHRYKNFFGKSAFNWYFKNTPYDLVMISLM